MPAPRPSGFRRSFPGLAPLRRMAHGAADAARRRWRRPHFALVALASLLVPRSLRSEWKREWEAELAHREAKLARWSALDAAARAGLLRRSVGAIADAVRLQPRRLEEEMFQDVRYGSRMLLKERGFTLVAVLTLALGVGAATAIFSVVNAVLLRSLPYDSPDRVVAIVEHRKAGKAQVTPANFLDWRERQHAFERMAAYFSGSGNIAGGAEGPERVRLAVVSANFFETLGARPALGRAFLPSEEAPGHDPVAVISYGEWQSRFAGDRSVLGKMVSLDGKPYTVVGVMPPSVRFPADTAVWRPAAGRVPEPDVDLGDVTQVRGLGYLGAVARLAPGVSVAAAQADMDAVTGELRSLYPESNAERFDDVVPLRDSLVGDVRPALYLLLGAVGCLLLIACANVANLLLARASAREREMAVRAALGASRLRLVRQLLTESVLLALAGGVLGAVFARVGVVLVARLAEKMLPPGFEVGVDPSMLAFALALAAATGILFGLAPALHTSRVDPQEALAEGGRAAAGGGRGARMLRLFVVTEIALCLALLVGAGLLSRSLLRLRSVELGFSPRRVVTMQLAPTGAGYADYARKVAFFGGVIGRVAGAPGVEAVGAIDTLPLGPGPVNSYVVEGRTPDPAAPQNGANRRVVAGDYFRAMNVPVEAGRVFGPDDDRDDAPYVAVVNEAFVRREFPNEDPLGKRISFSANKDGRIWLTIVGVVGDVRTEGASTEPNPEAYLPLSQKIVSGMTIAVLAADGGGGGDASAGAANAVAAVRAAVEEIDRDQPIANVRTMERVVADSLAGPTFNAVLCGLFATVALAMAAAGVYGVMAYTVSRRTREIGIRIALGATPREVLRMVVGHGARMTVAGIAAGLAGALVVSRLMESMLFGVTATDPVTFLAAVPALGGAALLACYVAARRAAHVDPMVALRHD